MKDPIYTLNSFRYRTTMNVSRWEHPTYQELLDKSDHEIDPDKRKNHMHQAEELLMEEMPIIPICFRRACRLSSKHLKNVYSSPLGELDFRYAYFE